MKNYKGVLYGAVIYSVIIGLIYVTLSLLGLLSRWNVIESTGSPVMYMLYLLYFRVGVGETINWDLLGITSDVLVNLPEETQAVQRTLTLFIIYLALHASLVIISLYALCGVNNSCLGSRSCALFFMPWILVWIAIIGLDLTATTFYIIDSVKLSNTEGFEDFLGIGNFNVVGPELDRLEGHVRFLPPIIMTITAAKLFFFLLINVAWVVAISRAGWAASTYHKYVDNSRRNYQNNMGTQNPAFDGFDPKNRNVSASNSDHRSSVSHELPITSSAPPEHIETRYNDTARVQGFTYAHNMPQNTNQKPEMEEELSFRIQRPITVAPQERPSTVQVQHYERTVYRTEPVDDDIENRLSRFQESNGVVIRTVEPLKHDDIPEQQKSIIGVRVLPPSIIRSQSDLKPKPTPPPKPFNNRYSMQPMSEIEEPAILYRAQDRPTNPVKLDRNSSSQKNVPAELRNQFAFNYLDPNNQVPKRAFQNLSEDEEPPNVPVPDYTLHFPPNNRRRTNLNNSFDEDYSSQWSQQNQQRY